MIKVDNINKLPTIIIKKIISLITNNNLCSSYFQISKINKQFYKQCKDTTYYLAFDGQTSIPLDVINYLGSSFKSTLSLSLKKCTIKISNLSTLIHSLTNLIDLELSYCTLLTDQDDTLKSFLLKLNNHPFLINLILSFNQIDIGILNELECSLIHLSRYFKINLTINLINCSTCTINTISSIMKSNEWVLNLLDLNNCKIGRDLESLTNFTNVFSGNLNLVTLDLSDNQISDGAAVVLSNGLKVNKSIQLLNISNNDIKSIGCEAIANSLIGNNTLTNLQFTNNSFDGSLDAVASLCEMIGKNKKLMELNLSCNKITISNSNGMIMLESLSRNTSLKTLVLQRNSIDNIGVEYIARGLSVNKSLTSIDLSFNKFSNPGASVLSRSIAYNSGTCIRSINLSSNCIGDSGASSFVDLIFHNSTVTHLDLSINWINSNGVIELSNSFKDNPSSSITSIDLSCNTICHVGAKSLGEALSSGCSIRHLNLFGNNLETQGAIELFESIVDDAHLLDNSLKNLTFLELSSNSIGNDGVASLSKHLRYNKSICSLSLSQSLITSDGVGALVDLLSVNKTITFLDLSNNNIGPVGVALLSVSFLYNSNSITSLDLSSNHIGDDGGCSISKIFPSNSILSRLSLYNNKIGSVGAISIVDNLILNHSLYSINLLSNRIDSKILKPILKRLEHSQHVRL